MVERNTASYLDSVTFQPYKMKLVLTNHQLKEIFNILKNRASEILDIFFKKFQNFRFGIFELKNSSNMIFHKRSHSRVLLAGQSHLIFF